MQVFDLMESSDGTSYVFIDQRQSDVVFHDKPGISCLDALYLENKTATGKLKGSGKSMLV